MVMKILKEQGVAGLYRGFGASMLNTFSMQLCVPTTPLPRAGSITSNES
jgi:hypothetical protein